MTKRKFTPPTKFPAEYFNRDGDKAVIIAVIPDDEFPYIGYTAGSKPGFAWVQNWTRKGRIFEDNIKGHHGDDIFDTPPKKQSTHDDLTYSRTDMEAAIKRALEGAAQACEDIRQRQLMGPMPEKVCFDQEHAIRALDPAQFIEEGRV